MDPDKIKNATLGEMERHLLSDDPQQLNEISMILDRGHSPPNRKFAPLFRIKAARLGNADAQLELSNNYYLGKRYNGTHHFQTSARRAYFWGLKSVRNKNRKATEQTIISYLFWSGLENVGPDFMVSMLLAVQLTKTNGCLNYQEFQIPENIDPSLKHVISEDLFGKTIRFFNKKLKPFCESN